MNKKIKRLVKLQIKGGEANPAPPIGTCLGPFGINMMSFCNEFNKKTNEQKGEIIPVVVTIYEDRTFSFTIKTSLVTYMIKKAIGIKKGSSLSKTNKVGKITKEQIKNIATYKLKELNAYNVSAAIKTIEGTVKSMGVEIEK